MVVLWCYNKMMKIILVVENERGRSSLLVADDGAVYTLAEVLELAREGQISGLQVATRNGVSYLRASRRRVGVPALQDVSISRKSILSISSNTANVFSRAQFRPFWDFYQDQLEKEAALGKLIVSINGQPFDTQDHVRSVLQPYKDYIFSAAEHFKVDPYLLAAILIDEIIRLAPFEEVRDKVAIEVLGVDFSVGIGQVTIETARGLIRNGYYNPNPKDSALDKQHINKVSRQHTLTYLKDPKHNVYFAAAKIRSLIDEWKSRANIDILPAIIATLYHFGHKVPHPYPRSDSRGEQIVNEFDALARKILTSP